jgi:predicted site-specific integrase-resolvase
MHGANEPPNGYVDVAGEPHILLTEVIKRLHIDRKTAYRWRDRGRLTHRHYLGRVCCPADQVIRLQLEQETGHGRG